MCKVSGLTSVKVTRPSRKKVPFDCSDKARLRLFEVYVCESFIPSSATETPIEDKLFQYFGGSFLFRKSRKRLDEKRPDCRSGNVVGGSHSSICVQYPFEGLQSFFPISRSKKNMSDDWLGIEIDLKLLEEHPRLTKVAVYWPLASRFFDRWNTKNLIKEIFKLEGICARIEITSKSNSLSHNAEGGLY